MEEQEERERQKEWAALEEQLRQRLELQEAHRDHLELKKQKDEAQRAEDEEFRRQVLQTTYVHVRCYMCTYICTVCVCMNSNCATQVYVQYVCLICCVHAYTYVLCV